MSHIHNPASGSPAQPGGEAFPVGSVFLSVVSTNPATLLGYGTWSEFGAGRALVGLDPVDPDFDTVEEAVGAKTKAISAHAGTAVADHAAHTHTVTAAGTNSAPTFTGSAMGTHAHELPLQLVSGTSTRHLPAATFGTGTSRAAQGADTATANTTSAAVALSQAVSAGTPAGTVSAPTFTGAQVTSGNPSAVLTHSVTQPSAHAALNVVQPSIVVYMWKRTA